MDFSPTFSPHLKATDVPVGRQYTCTIVSAEVQAFAKFGAGPNQPKQSKLVLGLAETQKSVVCNQTNAKALADAFGSDTSALIGKQIVLSQYSTNMGPAIKVTALPQSAQVRAGDPFVNAAPRSAAAPQPQPLPAIDPTTVGDFDDEIPF